MNQKSYQLSGIALLALGLVPGCASSNSASTTTDDIDLDGAVEMVVRNRSPAVVTVFALWEGGARVWLGELRGGQNGTFSTPPRDTEVWLSLDVISPGAGLQFGGGGYSPPVFVTVAPGDRIEWTIFQALPPGVGYRRLPPN